MKRRTLALLLTAALVISCLAGCGGQSEPPAQSPAPEPASPASQAPETPLAFSPDPAIIKAKDFSIRSAVRG